MPRIRTAHKFSAKHRTSDVLTEELVDFKSLLLSRDVLKGLNSSGFERPSPIQLKAIPLGRCGLDLIAQAKSGTGKTCVFSVIALESILPDINTTQALVLAPTREIAVQIKDVLSAIGSEMRTLSCHAFIGGINVEEDKKVLKRQCHVAVGTPGRIKYLIEHGFLKTESVRLFILDEADKLLDESFQEQINWIFSSLPPNKQMMAFSATYPEYLASHLTRYMREPTFVRLNATDPTLQGIRQFYQLVPFHSLPHKTFQEKVSQLLKLLSSVSFHQCLVFSNYQIRAQSLCENLCAEGWPSVFIAGSQSQTQRLKAMEKLKQFKCRVLISTDLTSRGIDAENVNLVVNMEVPRDSETYLHRIGRAGRFGTHGVAVTYVAYGDEEKLFRTMATNIGVTIDLVPGNTSQSVSLQESKMFPSISPQPVASSIEVDILKRNSASTVVVADQHKQADSHATEPQDAGVRKSEKTLAVSEEQKEKTTDTDFNVEKKEDKKEKTGNNEARVQFSPTVYSSRDTNSPSLRTNGLSENLLLNFTQKCQISNKHYQETFENTAENEEYSFLGKPSDDHISVQDDTLQSNLLQYGCSGSEPKSSTDSTSFSVSKDCSKEEHVILAHLKNTIQDGFDTVHQRLKETVLHVDGNQKPESIKESNDGAPDSQSLDSPRSKSSDSDEEFESCGKLPSATEFERDFEEYLKNSSSFLDTQESEKNIKESMNGFPRENKFPVYSDSDNSYCSENQLHDIGVTSRSNQYFGHASPDTSRLEYTCSGADHTNIVGCDSQNLETFQVPYSQLYQLKNNHCCYYGKGPLNATAIGNNYRYEDFYFSVDNAPDFSSYLEQASSSAFDPFPNSHFHAFDDENCQHFFNPNHYYTDPDSQNYWRTCGPGYSAQLSHGSRSSTDKDTVYLEDGWHDNFYTCKFRHRHKLQWNARWCNAYWRQTTLLRDFLLYSKLFAMS